MAQQFYTILTAVGKAKIANAVALGETVELTELALGDGGGSYYDPTEDQTSLRNEVWRGAIGTIDVDEENPNWIIIQAVVPSQHGGFMIREAGVFDHEGDLIAVGKYPETYKPTAADGSIKDLIIRMILEVSNAASVVLRIDPTVVLATQQQVNEAEARAKAYTDQEVDEVSQALAAHKAAAAPHSGHETPAGAQAKADAAETNAKNHASSLIGTLSNLLTTAKNNVVAAINEIFEKLVGTNLGLGLNASAGNYSVALGYNASAAEDSSVALGRDASAEDSSVALGRAATATRDFSLALGRASSSTGLSSVALGYRTSATGDYSVALGQNASAGFSSVALGQSASATGNSSVALGLNALVENNNEGILGGTGSASTSKWIVPGSFTVNGTKNFEIPHPKPEKKTTHIIRHGAVESPTPGDTLYRWKIQATKDNDVVTIDLPDYFIYLNKDVQIFVTGQGHFGNGYGTLNRETEQLEIHCENSGEYNVLVIGTRNDDHPSVQEWSIKGVEREIGESWTGETYAFSIDEIIEIEEIKEVGA